MGEKSFNPAWLNFGASLGGDLLGGMFGAIDGALSRQWQEKMWHMQNEYNSPKAQIARLKEAGLNPAMMYSNGSAGGPSASVPSAPAPIMKGMKLDFARALQAKRDAELQDKQLTILDKELQMKEKAIEHQDEVNRGLRLDNDQKEFYKTNGMWEFMVNKSRQEQQYMTEQINKIIAETDMVLIQQGIMQNQETRNQELHKWIIKAKELESQGLSLDNAWKEVRNKFQTLDYETKEALHKMGFDVNNPPQNFAQYQEWVKVALSDAQARAAGTQAINNTMGKFDACFDGLPQPIATFMKLGSRFLINYFE